MEGAERARAIRDGYAAGDSQKQLSVQFGLSIPSVSRIFRGHSYKTAGGPVNHPTNPRPDRLLTKADADAIRARAEDGETIASLVRAYGVSRDTIRRILRWATYKF